MAEAGEATTVEGLVEGEAEGISVDSDGSEVIATTIDPATATKLIEDHVDLVRQVVLQVSVHFPRHVDRQELARSGALGLVEAARRFDPSRGVPFDKFAARRIKGSILDAVRAADWAPRSVRTLARRMEQAEQQLAAAGGKPANPADVAAAMGLSSAELHRLRDRVFRSVVLALEQVVTGVDNQELTLLDVMADRTAVEPAEELEARELRGYLHDAVTLLPERHRMVIVGYFLEGRSSIDLANLLGVTESRISQIRSEALAMLKDGIEAQYRPADQPTTGTAARRRARYAESISEARGWRDRLVSA